MPTSSQIREIEWDVVGDEVITYVRNLLRLDTRNPPGNETRAAEYLRGILEREGIACEIVGPGPDRGTIVGRLKGDGSAPPLLLMSHTDVVAVEPEKWTHDPFAAEIDDGFIYGRGAMDMKHMVTMELMTILLLKRAGVPLKRDVIFMAAADEEVGGHQGAGWVAHHRPELIQAEYALNEGGGNAIEINGRRYYTVQTAEKGAARFRLRAKGKPGHGSVPHEDNAITKLVEVLSRLGDRQPPVHFSASFRGLITGIASAQPPEIAQLILAILANEQTADVAIDALPMEDLLKQEMRAMIRNTIAPTVLRAGSQINVIPSEAEALLDGRIVPGCTTEMFLGEIRAIFGEDADIEFIDPNEALEADPASPLFEVIKDVMREHDAEATVVPTLLVGGTDAQRVAGLGTKVYGFAPEMYISGLNDWDRIHGHDERINIRSLQWGTRVLYDVVARFACSD
ncbi:MAG TPA: M20/M25/M40 family metallo-hydrolase [Ktedonobacteraceae bacterium]|nr:M20/M25/M40 family metallo-hydrolase [Ktedonobacteraceae bacterium]